MRAVAELAAVTAALAALLFAIREWLRTEHRPAAQHSAPRSMIVEVLSTSLPPAGYGAGETTDQWLATAPPRMVCDFGQLAPAVLDAGADTLPPWPAPVETPPERDAWVQASLAADQPLEEPVLAPLPQLGCRPVLPPLARQHVWEPRPGPVPSGRHRAAGPDSAAAVSDRDFVRSFVDDSEPAEERATDLPLVVYAQLGGRTTAEYVDELFAGMVVTRG